MYALYILHVILTVNMKKSSTNTAPKGRIPAIRDLQRRETLSKKITDKLLQCQNVRKERVKVPHLLRYLSWNLVGSHRVLIRLLPESKVKSSKGEREGDTKPHTDQDEHRRKGYGSRRMHPPDEKVEEESSTKYNCGEKCGRLDIEKTMKK